MTDLVCPDCGHGKFAQSRVTQTNYLMEYSTDGGWIEINEEQTDSGDMADSDIACDDCGYVVENDGFLARYADACPQCESRHCDLDCGL